jgi:aspartate-semialdehyde dehydrogenase
VKAEKFTKRIAFNAIPHIDVFMEDGYTKEEWKMMAETKKILDPKIKLTATCVRIPVFVSHSEAVNVEFENPISAEEAKGILRNAPGCLLIDKHEDGGYITPHEAAGEDATYISRVREDATVENGLTFWCVSDNLRKGAALNTVQIAEVLVNRGLIDAQAGSGLTTNKGRVDADPRAPFLSSGPNDGLPCQRSRSSGPITSIRLVHT